MKSAGALAFIINPYNQLEDLSRVLTDVGSEYETRAVFERWAGVQSFRTDHVWQKYEGSRWSRVINQAIAPAWSDCRMFLDMRGWARGYHRWNPPTNRGDLDVNDGLFGQTWREGGPRCAYGLEQHLPATTA